MGDADLIRYLMMRSSSVNSYVEEDDLQAWSGNMQDMPHLQDSGVVKENNGIKDRSNEHSIMGLKQWQLKEPPGIKMGQMG